MNTEQLEMSLGSAAQFRPAWRRQRRRSRAQWWFSQMRTAVDQAIEWPPAPVRASDRIALTPVRR